MIDKEVLEDIIYYLNRNKTDLEKQKANLMEIYCDIHECQKEIDKYVNYLNHELERCDDYEKIEKIK